MQGLGGERLFPKVVFTKTLIYIFFEILTGTSVKKLELFNANKITNNQNLATFTAPLYWCSGL